MRTSVFRELALALLCAGTLGISPLAVQADDTGKSDNWLYSGSVYLWGAGVDLETANGAEVDIDFQDILDNIKMAFMGTFEVRKSKWSLMTDVVYLRVRTDGNANVPVPLAPLSSVNVNVSADAEIQTWLVNVLGGYNVWQTERGTLDVVAGARFLHVKSTIGFGVNSARLSGSRGVSLSDSVWDGVVGVRGRVNLAEKWYIPYYADVGTGDSDLTWQAHGGLGYRFSWGDVSATYRYIDWNVSDSKLDNFNLSGPVLAATFHW